MCMPSLGKIFDNTDQRFSKLKVTTLVFISVFFALVSYIAIVKCTSMTDN